jgi:tetratricopeptide (TPR) repeat protein
MLLPIRAMILCVLMTAAPAFGASQRAHDDCNAGDAERNIAGCTLILKDRKVDKTTRGVAYVGRGLAFASKGELDRAMSDFTDAIRLNPNDPHAYNNRAIVWRDKGDPDRAIADFSEAIRINARPRSDIGGNGTGHVNVYSNRGLAWQAKGDFNRAMADFDRAIQEDGKDAEAYMRRGLAWKAQDDRERAFADLGVADALSPHNPLIRAALRELKGETRSLKEPVEGLLPWPPKK